MGFVSLFYIACVSNFGSKARNYVFFVGRWIGTTPYTNQDKCGPRKKELGTAKPTPSHSKKLCSPSINMVITHPILRLPIDYIFFEC